MAEEEAGQTEGRWSGERDIILIKAYLKIGFH